MCRDPGLCFDGRYLLNRWDNWGALVKTGWEKERSYIRGQMSSGGSLATLDAISFSLSPLQENLSKTDIIGKCGIHSSIQQILLHFFDGLGTALGAISSAQQ